MDRLDFAIKLSRRVGNILMGSWGRPRSVGTKSNFQDLVTDMDELSQEMIVRAIEESFPEDGILSEEGVNRKAERYWVIDPIDGTVNYAFGLPSFSVSIAYVVDGEPVLGVVHVPPLNETYYAVKGGGAFMNGERIRVSGRRELKKTVGLLGFFRGFTHRVLERFEGKVVRLRILGSIAVAGVYVAAGKADFAITKRGNPWDLAATCLVLREAGGTITDFRGENVCLESSHGFLFSNGLVHEDVLKGLDGLT